MSTEQLTGDPASHLLSLPAHRAGQPVQGCEIAHLACRAEPTSLLLHQLQAAMQVLPARQLLRPGPGCCLAGSPPLLPGCQQQQHPVVQPDLCWLLL